MVFNHDAEHVWIWALLGPPSIVTAFAGATALRSDQQREHLERTRAALDAQLLAAQAQTQHALAVQVDELMSLQHDVKSPLSAASYACQMLLVDLRQGKIEQAIELGSVIERSLERARQLLNAARTPASDVAHTTVLLAHALHVVSERVRVRFPDIILVLDQLDRIAVRAAGGEATIERILENLFVNACEGNGARGAHRILCAVRSEDSHFVIVTIEDDGPGFPTTMLERGVEPFQTAKRDGAGLGLFTAERLARACGGGLELENRADGPGARVSVRLLNAR